MKILTAAEKADLYQRAYPEKLPEDDLRFFDFADLLEAALLAKLLAKCSKIEPVFTVTKEVSEIIPEGTKLYTEIAVITARLQALTER